MDEGNVLENPKVCLYTKDLNPIFLKSFINVKDVRYEVRVVEVHNDFGDKEELRRGIRDQHSKTDIAVCSSGINEQTSLDLSVKESSLDTSRVPESFGQNIMQDKDMRGNEHFYSDSSSKKPKLVWDFPNSLDSGRNIINSGVLEDQGDTQNSLCSKLKNIKIKGPGRPKKRKLKKNPFEIGRCKLWFKANKEPIALKRKQMSQEKNEKLLQGDIEVEARSIMETATNMGFTLNVAEEEALELLKVQVSKGLI